MFFRTSIIMIIPIQLYSKFQLRTIKINNVSINTILPTKRHTINLLSL